MAGIERELDAGGVLTLRLNRPERLNAFTFEMFDELSEACAEAEADDSVRVIVVTGAGRGFSAGLDLDLVESLPRMSAQEMLTGQERWAAGIVSLKRVRKPVIAAVNGPAAGAGMALALAADIRIAVEGTVFVPAFIKVGLTGGDVGISWLLPRLVGIGIASELLLTGRDVGAEEAERIGLVNRVVPPDELASAVDEVAGMIASRSPFGVRLTKQVLQTNVDAPSLEAALELENRNQVLSTRTEDMGEALAAFREKRDAAFKGT